MTESGARLPGLIFVEGLPGSGKSTTAHRLALHLESLGHASRWIYEHERPHPIYGAASLIEILESAERDPAFCGGVVEAWVRLARRAGSGTIQIPESAVFQPAVHALFLAGRDPREIVAFVDRIVEAVTPLEPAFIWFRSDDIDAALRFASERRGEWFAGFLIDRISKSARGLARNLSGWTGVVAYFEAYRELSMRIFERLPIPKLVIDRDTTQREETFVAIAEFLGVPPIPARDPVPSRAAACVGVYRQADAEESIYDVRLGPSGLVLGGFPETPLIPRGDEVFEIEGACVELTFRFDGPGPARRIECRGALPNLGREWIRDVASCSGEVTA
jgi:hypothetical protein